MISKNAYIVTYTGKKVYPLNPDPETICIEDIAHSLAQKCRFSGHTKVFYSVAQHSIIVANLCSLPLWGLLHDAAEAYLPDVAATIKPYLPTLKYAEDICFEAIKKRFNLPDLSEDEEREIKTIDRAIACTEWDILINNPNEYSIVIDMPDVPQLHWKPTGFFGYIEAERVFLKTFEQLWEDKK
jgi:hypothetical protein